MRKELEQFIKENRKTCWESDYENGEYCLGENKVIAFVEVIQEQAKVKVNFAEEIEKQMLETQLVKIEVLNCKGDADGKYLPTEILLRLGDETKWYSQER